MTPHRSSTFRPFAKLTLHPAYLLLVLVVLAGLVAPPYLEALWMPWATEKDKIHARIDRIWAALLNRDLKTLKASIEGPMAATFIDQELSVIRTFSIRKFSFKIEQITLDPAKGEFAFVQFEKNAVQADGGKLSSKVFLVFHKVDGRWKLTLTKRKRRAAQEDEKRKKPGFIKMLKTGAVSGGASGMASNRQGARKKPGHE